MNKKRPTKKEVEEIMMRKPHVVILGAGASRAACPNGDKNGNILPLMDDLIEILEFNHINNFNIKSRNFEDIFSLICQSDKYKDLKLRIEESVYNYFEKLEIPDHPTIYDHLVLSLRKKDVIATFNWDPLLVLAYRRNGRNFELPNLLFLHGNVEVGYCENDNISGIKKFPCKKCSKMLEPTSLLYPITNKNYTSNKFLSSQWSTLQNNIRYAFMITFFGYGAPKTDVRAIELMKLAWGNLEKRKMEQIEIIDIKSEEELHETWKPFIFSHHYDIHSSFYNSWIANHPRRTVEAYYNQFWMAEFIDNNPIPQNLSFQELWEWFEPLK
jgi:hypothetical protein